MSTLEVSGVLKVKNGIQVISYKLSKREFVVTTDTDSKYPQQISFQLTQDKCLLIDNIQIGDEIKVLFNLRGREWNSPTKGLMYFNSLEAWKIEKISSSQPSAPSTASEYVSANPNKIVPAQPSTALIDEPQTLPF
jgi:hypothetical protein